MMILKYQQHYIEINKLMDNMYMPKYGSCNELARYMTNLH